MQSLPISVLSILFEDSGSRNSNGTRISFPIEPRVSLLLLFLSLGMGGGLRVGRFFFLPVLILVRLF